MDLKRRNQHKTVLVRLPGALIHCLWQCALCRKRLRPNCRSCNSPNKEGGRELFVQCDVKGKRL